MSKKYKYICFIEIGNLRTMKMCGIHIIKTNKDDMTYMYLLPGLRKTKDCGHFQCLKRKFGILWVGPHAKFRNHRTVQMKMLAD